MDEVAVPEVPAPEPVIDDAAGAAVRAGLIQEYFTQVSHVFGDYIYVNLNAAITALASLAKLDYKQKDRC